MNIYSERHVKPSHRFGSNLYGDLQINRNGLELPSSDIEKYKFVLEPLAEIAPDYIHPILKKSYKDLLESSFL